MTDWEAVRAEWKARFMKAYEQYPQLLDKLKKRGDEENWRWGGFQHDKGWDTLTLRVLKELHEVVSTLPETERKHYAISGVKEKFASLTIYMQQPSEQDAIYRDDVAAKIAEILARADEDSQSICEVCGQPGEVRYYNWYRTLCGAHRDPKAEAALKTEFEP